jgi:hypothetical protein
MLTGWVTYGTDAVDEANDFTAGDTYYCGEDGARLEKAWVYTTEPGTDDDDADADEYWYYLKSSGKVQTGKATNIGGQTYIFGNVEGGDPDTVGGYATLLEGWVGAQEVGSSTYYYQLGYEGSKETLNDATYASIYYAETEDEGSDGHVAKNRWLKTWNPVDFYDQDADDDQWIYWVAKDGKVYIPRDSAAASATKYKLEDAAFTAKKINGTTALKITKKKVNSKDYFFNEGGEMVSQFVYVSEASGDLAEGLYYFGGDSDGYMKTGAQSIKDDNGDFYKFYFGTSSSSKKGVGITGNKSGKLYDNGLLVYADDYKYQVAEVAGEYYIINKNGAIQTSKVEYKEDSEVLINAKTATFVTTSGDNKGSISNADTVLSTLTSKVGIMDATSVLGGAHLATGSNAN